MLIPFGKSLALNAIQRMGYELRPLRSDFSDHLVKAQHQCASGTLIDVGANRGDYTQTALDNGFSGAVLLVEPLPDLYKSLVRRFRECPRCTVLATAVAADCNRAVLYRGRASATSSLLRPDYLHVLNTPAAATVDEVEVATTTMDVLASSLKPPYFIKLDVQGAEHLVLKGAIETLRQTRFLQIEASLTPLYEESIDLRAILGLIHELGFQVVDLHRGYWLRKDSRLGQIDLLCRNSTHAPG